MQLQSAELVESSAARNDLESYVLRIFFKILVMGANFDEFWRF